MKSSYYDILQVSPRATPEIIKLAYENLKASLQQMKAAGDESARDRLLFLEEAYAVLCSPERRAAYDAGQQASVPTASLASAPAFEAESGSPWFSRLSLGVLIACIVFGVYKFRAQSGGERLQEKAIENSSRSVQNDAFRAESERALANRVVDNQERALDQASDMAERQAARQQLEAESRARAREQSMELERQRHEARLEEQRWRQEQYEKDRELREQRVAADAPKRQLCNMYQLNGKYAEARAAGCSSLSR